jgi:hypothetical protein
MEKIPKTENTPEKDWPWYWKILNWVGDAIMGRLLGAIGLDEELARLFYSWINERWDFLMMKLFKNDPYIKNIHHLFSNRVETALREYLRNNGNGQKLLDAIFNDLIGYKK